MTVATAPWVAPPVWAVPKERMSLLLRLVSERCVDRFCESSFHGPTIPESIIDNSPTQSCPDDPIGNAQSLAVQCQAMILGCVARLFMLRSPFAIIWRVSLIVIDALDRRVRRSLSHVGQEILEVHPSLTNTNAAASVYFEVNRPGINTPRFHRRPNLVLTRSQAGSITSMFGAPLAMDATTTLGIADHEVANKHNGVVAAVATTSPRTITYGFDNRQSPEPLTAVVRCGWMKLNWGYSLVSHAVSSFVGDGVVRGCLPLATAASLAFNYSIKTSFQGYFSWP